MQIPPSTVYQWTVDRNDFAVDFARARDFGDQVLEDEAVDISDTMEEASETIDSFSEKHGASSTVKKGDAVAHRRLRAEVRLKVVARRKDPTGYERCRRRGPGQRLRENQRSR